MSILHIAVLASILLTFSTNFHIDLDLVLAIRQYSLDTWYPEDWAEISFCKRNNIILEEKHWVKFYRWNLFFLDQCLVRINSLQPQHFPLGFYNKFSGNSPVPFDYCFSWTWWFWKVSYVWVYNLDWHGECLYVDDIVLELN